MPLPVHLSSEAAIFFATGVSIVLPLGARLAGNAALARRLDLLPRFTFGVVCVVMAFLPQLIFRYAKGPVEGPGAGPVFLARVLFSGMGSFLLARGILELRRRRREARKKTRNGGEPHV